MWDVSVNIIKDLKSNHSLGHFVLLFSKTAGRLQGSLRRRWPYIVHGYLWAGNLLQPFLIYHIFKFFKFEIFDSETIVLREHSENNFKINLEYHWT